MLLPELRGETQYLFYSEGKVKKRQSIGFIRGWQKHGRWGRRQHNTLQPADSCVQQDGQWSLQFQLVISCPQCSHSDSRKMSGLFLTSLTVQDVFKLKLLHQLHFPKQANLITKKTHIIYYQKRMLYLLILLFPDKNNFFL